VTGFKIDAFGKNQYEREKKDQATLLSEVPDFSEELTAPLAGVGINTVKELLSTDEENVLSVDEMNDENLEQCYLVVQAFIERVEEEIEEEEDLEIKEIIEEVNAATNAEIEAMAQKEVQELNTKDNQDEILNASNEKTANEETEENLDENTQVEEA